MRILPVVVAWLVAGAASLLFATTSALGPTLVTVGGGRGAQAGDVAVSLALAGAATLAIRRIWPPSGREVRLLLVGATWALAAAISLLVAVKTAVGPSVLHLSSEHGVHSGDVAAMLVAAAGAGAVTRALLAPGRGAARQCYDRRP